MSLLNSREQLGLKALLALGRKMREGESGSNRNKTKFQLVVFQLFPAAFNRTPV